MALMFELAGDGHLETYVKEKMRNQARGKPMPNVETIRPTTGKFLWILSQAKQLFAVLRIMISTLGEQRSMVHFLCVQDSGCRNPEEIAQ